MNKIAILSDIHGNLQVLEAIIKDIRIVLGNHEEYFIKGAYNFDEVGTDERKHQEWVKSNLNKKIENKLREYYKNYLFN